MNKYELAIIFNPNLDEETLKAELEKTQDIIKRFGGEVDKIDDWGKRKLAYEIKKVNDGFYYFINFSADSSVPAEVESRVRIMESVLRYLIFRLDQ